MATACGNLINTPSILGMSSEDVEFKCDWLLDATGQCVWFETSYSYISNTWSPITYYDAPGGNVITPVEPLKPLVSGDYEVVCFFDVQPDSTVISFLRHIRNGGAVYDTELDGTTPYVVTGQETCIPPQSTADTAITCTVESPIESGPFTIPANAYSVSIFNNGPSDGLFLGQVIRPGESKDICAKPGCVLPELSGDATGGQFEILVVR